MSPLPLSRKKLEALVYKNTHADYRGRREDGTRCVLHMETGVTHGTESWPLSKFTEDQLLAKLPKKIRDEITEVK